MTRLAARFLRVISCISLVLAIVDAQNADFDPSVNHYSYSFSVANDSANGFSVEYYNWYKVVTNHQLNERYALVCCDQPLDNFTQYNAAINTPVKNVGIENVRDILPYLELLSLSDSVKAIQGYQNVTSPCYANVTDTPGSNTVDLMFSERSNTNLQGNPPYVGFTPNNDTLSPLQKASWLVYIAMFFEMEGEATTIFGNIYNIYNCHKANLEEMTDKKNIAWTSYNPTDNSWTIVNDNFHAALVKDAGALLISPNSAQSNVFTQLNEFHTAIRLADYVIDVTPLENLGNQSYDSWLNLGGFVSGTDIYNEPFIADKGLYRTDGLVNNNGISDWSQRSPARPDLALRDVIHMFAPTYEPDYQLTWLRNFAKGDYTRQIADSGYQCNATEIVKKATCDAHKYGSDSEAGDEVPSGGHSLSTGGKAGISVGVIVFAIGAAVIAFFLYRRHRQVKASRPFYRMNDVS
ncbi:hypothetical protein RO3G_16336 [Lichtheimia corymbifera JMRC:FSU:9682]|uniref:Periplasmic binding protein n=1 Tax=Lichtheimia corymbifera JMRC:FSU:9682 TaxID=1263082 RepID=A0A068S4B0_9FUNG|nr:hypothetical protein RO3G_16336 [Lichtheimia corymbifera JMRC:FSU:9682]